MPTEAFEPAFIDFLPDRLEDGVLYISIEYTTVAHLCACGCGHCVISPLSPAQWSLTFDGASVTIRPSIGSWQLPCRSHYVIHRNRVRWARPWTDAAITEGRRRDAEALKDYLGGGPAEPSRSNDLPRPEPVRRRWWHRLFAHRLQSPFK